MKKVYVIYDPNRKEIICVHNIPHADCDECKRSNFGNTDHLYYQLEEYEFEVKSGKKLLKTK